MSEIVTASGPIDLDPAFDWEQIDKLIWKGAGTVSVRKLAEQTGLTPDQVLKRKNQLYDEVDVLTIAQKRQKLVIDMQRLADDAKTAADRSPLEFKAGLLNSAIAAIKAVLGQLDRLDKQDTTGVEKLNALRVKELVGLINETVDHTLVDIQNEYGVPLDEMQTIFDGHLRVAAAKRDASE